MPGWAPTTVPNASNAGDFSNASYLGSVHWYRKDFRLPRASEASKWVLRFESVNYRARVWLNGKPLGAHVGAYLPFELRAKSVRRRGTNRLVVRVDSRRQKFDIPPLSQRASGAFEGGWWNYNGILARSTCGASTSSTSRTWPTCPACAAARAPRRSACR